jgi:integrase
VHVRRAFRVDRLKTTKTDTPRAVPLQRSALDALDQLPSPPGATSLLFPAPEGGYLDLHNWRPRHWRPAQRAAGITPTRRVYDLRHTFATVALRAGLGTFELSRYMGTSLINIDRSYGHLARDSHQHAIELLDDYSSDCRDGDAGGRSVDVGIIPR